MIRITKNKECKKMNADIYGLRGWVIISEEEGDLRYALADDMSPATLKDLDKANFNFDSFYSDIGIEYFAGDEGYNNDDENYDEDNGGYYIFKKDKQKRHYSSIEHLIVDFKDEIIDGYYCFKYWNGHSHVIDVYEDGDLTLIKAFILDEYDECILFIPEYGVAVYCSDYLISGRVSPYFYYDEDKGTMGYSYQAGDEDRDIGELLNRLEKNRKN